MAKNLAVIFKELFYFFSALLSCCVLLEIVWPNIILDYFNLNYLIVICLLIGSISLIKK